MKKAWASFLALLLAAPSFGQAPAAAPPAPGEIPVEISTEAITVTAPREVPGTAGLKAARDSGAAVAVGGAGLMAYSIFISAGGPFTLAAGLLLLGGLTAYLAHRRLKGHEDFSPQPSAPGPGAAVSTTTAAGPGAR